MHQVVYQSYQLEILQHHKRRGRTSLWERQWFHISPLPPSSLFIPSLLAFFFFLSAFLPVPCWPPPFSLICVHSASDPWMVMAIPAAPTAQSITTGTPRESRGKKEKQRKQQTVRNREKCWSKIQYIVHLNEDSGLTACKVGSWCVWVCVCVV